MQPKRGEQPTDAELRHLLRVIEEQDGNARAAGRVLGIAETTVRRWQGYAEERQLTPEETAPHENEVIALKDEVRTLEKALREVRKDEMTREAVRKHILDIADADPDPPNWVLKPHKPSHVLGVPTLFLSDWHWGEVVNPLEIAGANQFNTEIAHARARKLFYTATDLLMNRFVDPDYPGIVVALGGDLVTGTIHEDLVATNDHPIGPTVLDLFGILIWLLNSLKKEFGRVFVAGVAGNHGRLTRKVLAKERAATNWDWLVMKFVERHFSTDPNITFLIPDGPDAIFSIYKHRYCLTHGDAFRGGDGLIGPLGPLTRGRHKKASRDVSLHSHWDTLMCGHFHTLMQLPHLIVNGSLKGLDEYAFQNHFGFERAAQALWITHPVHGISFQCPVYVDDGPPKEEAEWVSWQE